MAQIAGRHIDWDARKDPAAAALAAATAAIPAAVVARALAAYENAPPGTGLEGRMALAIHAVTRRSTAPGGAPVVRTGS